MQRKRTQSWLSRWSIFHRKSSRNPAPANRPKPAIRARTLRQRLAHGMIAIALSTVAGNHYEPPFAHVVFAQHTTLNDGKDVAREFEHFRVKNKIGVIAIENAAATIDDNKRLEEKIQTVRENYQEWMKKNNISPATAYEEAIKSMTGVDNPFHVPIIAKSIAYNIPIRSMEEYDEITSKKLKEIHGRAVRLLNSNFTLPDMKEGHRQTIEVIKLLRQEHEIRDPVMQKKLYEIHSENKQHGKIFATVGTLHQSVARPPVSTKTTANVPDALSHHMLVKQPIELMAGKMYLYQLVFSSIPKGASEKDKQDVLRTLENLDRMKINQFNQIISTANGLEWRGKIDVVYNAIKSM